MARLLCLLYTENMFMLKQMRKNLKKKLINVVDTLAPEIFENFNSTRHVKRKSDVITVESTENEETNKQEKYLHEMELNAAFEVLKEICI